MCIVVLIIVFNHTLLINNTCSWAHRLVGELPPQARLGSWARRLVGQLGATGSSGSRGHTSGSRGRLVGEQGPQAQRGGRPTAGQAGPTDTWKNSMWGPKAQGGTSRGLGAAGPSGS